jgi:hypothetical protein
MMLEVEKIDPLGTSFLITILRQVERIANGAVIAPHQIIMTVLWRWSGKSQGDNNTRQYENYSKPDKNKKEGRFHLMSVSSCEGFRYVSR